MPFILIEFLTEDENLQKLCQLFWEIDDHGKFVHKVVELNKQFNLTPNTITKVLQK